MYRSTRARVPGYIFGCGLMVVLLSAPVVQARALSKGTGQHQSAGSKPAAPANPSPADKEGQPPALAAGTPVDVCRLDLWSCQDPRSPKTATCLYGSLHSGGCAPPPANTPACAASATNEEPTLNYRLSPPDARNIAKALGNAAPFMLTALDATTLVISRSPGTSAATRKNAAKGASPDLSAPDESILNWLRILVAAGTTASFELEIPHARSLGDVEDRINELHSPLFSAQAAGQNKVKITAARTPSCEDLQAFVASVQKLAWGVQSESPVARVYSLDASTATTLLNAAAASSGAAAAKTPAPPADTSAPNAPDIAPDSDDSEAGAGGTGDAAGKTKSGDDAAASGDGKNAGSDSKNQPQSSAGSLSPAAAGNDLIVFSASANTGDDSQITEQKRILALLDLPRPEMIINGWVVQNSTRRADKFGAANQLIRQTVNDHNDGLQLTILAGWEYIKTVMSGGDYFDPSFYDYLTKMVVLDNAEYADPADSPQPGAAMQRRIALAEKIKVDGEPGQNVCPPGQYCLGYTTLFEPLQPRLTNLLLAIIAAKDPVTIVNCAVNRIEDVADAPERPCGARHVTQSQVWAQSKPADLRMRHADLKGPDEAGRERERVEETASALGLSRQANDGGALLDEIRDCETADQVGMIRQEIAGLLPDANHRSSSPAMYMECFRRTASLLLRPNAIGESEPSELGLTRRAVADFLFHYKMSQQYPHEFTPYDLTQSADAFNAALNPLVEAFNRDLTAYQGYLRENLRTSLMSKKIATSGGFLNDGIISVRTVSGHSASADTTTQSYLDASSAPDLNALATAVTGALGGGSSASGAATKGIAAAATGGLSVEAQAVLAGLSTYQTTKINVGRSLNLQVTPRSTVGASGAEMDVQLTASESADPKYWSGGSQGNGDPDISRVATHDVKTHVRVDSILLFDLSSFSAVLAKGRPLLPLLPPFVELPYIGTLAGIPLPAAKEYHSSSAIVSAVVVPTAADLAFGIRFISDAVLDSTGVDCSWSRPRDMPQRYDVHYCAARRAQSLRDLADQPIREFHRRKLQCFATDQSSSVPYADDSAAKCDGLQFSEVEHSAP